MHPKGSFCGGEAKCGSWLETSVGGGVFSLRESRSAQQIGRPVIMHSRCRRFVYTKFQVENETNVLQDGTLIDLCGATLLWRSAEGLAKSPVSQHFCFLFTYICHFFLEQKRLGKGNRWNQCGASAMSCGTEHFSYPQKSYTKRKPTAALRVSQLRPRARFAWLGAR